MSHFLGVSILPVRRNAQGLEGVASLFDRRIQMLPIAGTSFESALIGGAIGRLSVGLVSGGTSTDLLGKGYGRSSLVAECREGLRRVLEVYGGLTVLLHVFRGDVRSELVSVKASMKQAWNEFDERFPLLDENVRYTVT